MYKEVCVLNVTVYIISGTPVNVKIHRSLSAKKKVLEYVKNQNTTSNNILSYKINFL